MVDVISGSVKRRSTSLYENNWRYAKNNKSNINVK